MTVATVGVERQVRVAIAVRAEFEGETFLVRELTANLSIGGLFLCTERVIAPRTHGVLTFQHSQWDHPFELQAEVVHVVPEGQKHPQGLGIQFVELEDAVRERLERLVQGLCQGSISEAIRSAARERGGDLLRELRRRPAGQKVTFAAGARPLEIDALIRDGNPAVIAQLLDSPHLSLAHVRMILRDPRVPVSVVSTLGRTARWMTDRECRVSFCAHPNSPLQAALNQLKRVDDAGLEILTRNANLREQVRQRAKQERATRRR